MDLSNELYKLTERKASANVDYSLLLQEIKELFECGLVRALAHLASAPVGSLLKLVQVKERERRRRERGSHLTSIPVFISVKSWVSCVESPMITTWFSMTYLSSQ